MRLTDLAKNLATEEPRSPFAELGAYPWLARIIDKARATAAGTPGDYQYGCPIDQAFLRSHGLTAREFLEVVAAGAADDDIVAYMHGRAVARSPEEVRRFEVRLPGSPRSNEGGTSRRLACPIA